MCKKQILFIITHNLIINKKHKLEEGKKEFIEYTKYLKYDNKIHTPLWGGSI